MTDKKENAENADYNKLGPQKAPLHREVDIKKHKEKSQKLNEENEEFGGQEGPSPTRYGDWEKGGRCTDF
jgi:hypothetical protein